uniref:Melanin-concentrating hormone receptor 1 n=1 Tax=Neovison vison TaxID=452646 RepID=A0A8C7A2S0_NEOVI
CQWEPGKEGVGREAGLGGGRRCHSARKTPFRTAGLVLRDGRAALPQPAWVDGRAERDESMSKGQHLRLLSPGPPPRTGSVSYINIIMPSVFGTICLLGIIGNSTVIFAVVKKSKLHWCSNVPDIFIINLSFFLAFALPFVVITAAYVRILQRMTSSVAPASQRSIRLRTKRVTRTAIAICLVFFVCWAPYYVLQLTQLSISRPTLTFVYLYNAAISLGYANSCLNPFVYIVLCETFRKRLVLSVKPAAQGQLRAISNAQTADEERTESKGT